MENNSLGHRIFFLRQSRGETLEAAAEAIGISHVSLMRYENGIRSPKADVLQKIANYYGTSIDDLIKSNKKEDDIVITSETPQIQIMARAMKMMTEQTSYIFF